MDSIPEMKSHKMGSSQLYEWDNLHEVFNPKMNA